MYQMPGAQPVPQPVMPMPAKKDNKKDQIKNIVIVVLALLAISFIALFFLKASDYNKLSQDFEDQVAASVAVRADARLTELEQEFDEKYKQPNTKFVGPEDYGRLEFDYPKTWSLYVASSARTGYNYEAYLNPGQVNSVSREEAYALKVEIVNESYDSVITRYKSNKDLTSSSTTIGGTSAMIFSGTIPSTEFTGKMAIFKIRDKTVILTTFDAVYEQDFNSIVKSVTFNS